MVSAISHQLVRYSLMDWYFFLSTIQKFIFVLKSTSFDTWYLGSILCTLAISYEWLSNFRLKLSSTNGPRNQTVLVAFIVGIAAAINVTKFMEYGDVTNLPSYQTSLRMNDMYILCFITVSINIIFILDDIIFFLDHLSSS